MRNLNPHEMYTWHRLREQRRLPLPLMTVKATDTFVDYCRMGSFTVCVLVTGRRFFVGVAKRACGLDCENPMTGRAIAFVRTLERGCEFFHRFPAEAHEDALELPDEATVIVHPSCPVEADWGALSEHDDDAYDSPVGVSLSQFMEESNGQLPHDDWCHDETSFDFGQLKDVMQKEVDRSREMLTMGVRPSLEHLVSAYVAFTDKALFDCGGELPDDVLLWLLQGWQAIADALLAVHPLWKFDEGDAIYQRFLDLGSQLAEVAISSAGGGEGEVIDDGPVQIFDYDEIEIDDEDGLPPVLTFAVLRSLMTPNGGVEIAA
jgi:hypothetical protein